MAGDVIILLKKFKTRTGLIAKYESFTIVGILYEITDAEEQLRQRNRLRTVSRKTTGDLNQLYSKPIRTVQ